MAPVHIRNPTWSFYVVEFRSQKHIDLGLATELKERSLSWPQIWKPVHARKHYCKLQLNVLHNCHVVTGDGIDIPERPIIYRMCVASTNTQSRAQENGRCCQKPLLQECAQDSPYTGKA